MKRSPITRRTPIRKVSKKRAKENRIRAEFTKEQLEAHPNCAIRSPVCTGRAQALHELLKRSAGGARIPGEQATRQQQRFIPACHMCNEYVQSHFKWSLEHGFAVSRHQPLRSESTRMDKESI